MVGGEATTIILPLALTNDLVTAGKIDPPSRVAIARAGSGVSVPAGSPKPDVSTAEALKRTLLQAKSIGFTGVGASRVGNEALLAKLGIADQVKPKIKLLNGATPAAVAKGEVEIGLGPMSEVLLVPGVQLAGPFPAGFQSFLVFMACVSSGTSLADAQRISGVYAGRILRGRKAGRSAGATVDKSRTGGQSQDRRCTRPDDSAVHPRPRRRGHRMTRFAVLVALAVCAAAPAYSENSAERLPLVGVRSGELGIAGCQSANEGASGRHRGSSRAVGARAD